jgi:exosome complex component RRP4
MNDVRRRYVIPGDKIAEGNYRPLMNVTRAGNALIATRIGIAETGREGVKVIPLSGVYIPRVNDLVIGKIVDHTSLSWEVDINSCFSANLPASDVFGRDFSPARDDMTKHLAIGDMITARVAAFDRTRDPMLTLQDRDLGKIPKGELLKISATRVPRLIGKRGSMIQTIEQATQTRVLIGQNGIVVVTGRSPEGIEQAVKAIRMVEDEAHTANLTQRIKTFLNVPDTQIEESPVQPNNNGGEVSIPQETHADSPSSATPVEVEGREVEGEMEGEDEK